MRLQPDRVSIMASREEAVAQLKAVLEKLDSLADESWVAESFIVDALVVGSDETGYTADIGTVLYGLQSMGEEQLALDLSNWISLTETA